MQLFGSYTSPFVRHCRIVLLETQTPFEFMQTDYTQSAAGSPTQKVPYLHDGSTHLHDSASIIKYLRQQAGEEFCATAESFDLFCLVNAALDSTINLFLLENSGIDIANNPYLERQANRIESCLAALQERAAKGLSWDDAGIRLACFIEWAEYRKRLDFNAYPALQDWLSLAQQQDAFVQTQPPQS
ncbi:glutathione S-transferase [Aliidiomarina minuta]|uniref:Glutathione S-transferase n=2 Tax=Aliidiomarina minuta TaxID=880057 RepID=A0A432W145_9GAMM|nr:glutathione S-transferase [Aliidiomarina minuta]